MRFRRQLFYLVLSVVLPATVASAIAVWFVYTEQKASQEQSFQEATRALSSLLDNELQTTEAMLVSLAASPALARGDLETYFEYLKKLAPTRDTVLVLSLPDGTQVLNTRLPPGTAPPKTNAGLQALRERLGPQRTAFSDLFFAPVGKRHDVAVQVPVMVDGQLRYYLARGLPAASFGSLLAAQKLPGNWVLSILDRKGVIVARSVDGARFVGKSATGSLAARLAAGEPSGINDGHTLDGREVRAFFHRSPLSEWTVVLSVPAAELRAPAVKAAMLLTAMMAAVLAIGLVLASRQAARTLAPIRRLADGATRLGNGEPLGRRPSGIIEFDAVDDAMAGASERIAAAKAELERRVADAVAAAESAQRALLQGQKLEALGRLTGGIAHDFNNVLQALSTSLQLVRLEHDPIKLADRLQTCERAIARATSLVSQLRVFGKMKSGQTEVVDPGEAVAAIGPLLRNALPSTIRLDIVCGDELAPVNIDPVQFELALLNLVLNARDAMPGGGTVAIEVRLTRSAGARDEIRVCVRDDGTGMPPDVVERAIDPFFTTKPVDKGSGLGLPQAYGFATQSGGSLTIDSTPGRGTAVTICLPVADGGQAEPDRTSQERPPALPWMDGTVLFVDDDELIRTSLVPILQAYGLRVRTAASGDEAIALLAAGGIDAVLSDIVMPGGTSGTDLARHVLAHHPGVGVVLATGYADDIDSLPGVRLLAKPYQAADAAAALRDAMAGALGADDIRAGRATPLTAR